MGITDIVILIAVILLVGVLIFVPLIKKLYRNKDHTKVDGCANCSLSKRTSGRRLVKKYNKKYRQKD